jgi:hypothetical protein
MGTVGLLLGPVDHYWYFFLDSQFPGTRAATVAKKVTLDILIFGPVSLILFFILMCRLEGKTWKDAVKETRQKFLTTYELDLLLWPAVQVINFCYVPAAFRVLFQNVFYVGWTMLLSYLKHHVRCP